MGRCVHGRASGEEGGARGKACELRACGGLVAEGCWKGVGVTPEWAVCLERVSRGAAHIWGWWGWENGGGDMGTPL
jgi:hypothetical protein